MATSQNGYRALPDSSECAKWVLPLKGGSARHVILKQGHAGFVLACLVTWFDRRVEKVNSGQWDEWGWAYRTVRGQTTGLSNHASGTAVDINATQHPLGVRNSFTSNKAALIRRKMRRWKNVIRWGGDYVSRADEMHFEINAGTEQVRKLAKRLRRTRLGRQVIKANPHYQPKSKYHR